MKQEITFDETMNKQSEYKNRILQCVLILLIGLILPILTTPDANASTFNVGATICAPSWFCTAFSSGTCGTRSCVDANVCGVNTNKPAVHIACPPAPGGGGGGGGGGGSGAGYPITTVNSTPIVENYTDFSLSTDILKIDINPDTMISKKIMIYSDAKENRHISIKSKSKDFLDMTRLLQTDVPGSGTFEITFNSSNYQAGVYAGIIEIADSIHSHNLTVIINILTQGPEFDLIINKSDKILNSGTVLLATVKLKDPGEITNITYSLLSDQGDVLYTYSAINSFGSYVTLPMPVDLKMGYYTLTVTVRSKDSYSTRTAILYADPGNLLEPYEEKTSAIKNLTAPYL